MIKFEDDLRARPRLSAYSGIHVEISESERDALADAVEALREIAKPDDLVAANEDAFSVHALRRCQKTAAWALAQLDKT